MSTTTNRRMSLQQRRLEAVLERYRDKEERPGAERRHLIRLWREYVYPLRWKLTIAMILNLLVASQQYIWSWITGYTADNILAWQTGIPLEELAYHYWLVILFFFIMSGIHTLVVVFTWWYNYLVTMVGQKVVFELRKALHEKLQVLPLSFFDGIQTGRLLSVVIDDVSTIQQAVATTAINWITHAGTLLIGALVICSINWKLGLLVLVALPLYVVNFRAYRPRLREGNITARRATAILWAKVEEKITAIRTVKVFGRDRAEARTFTEAANNLARLNMYVVRTRHTMQAIAQAISAIAIGLVLYLGMRALQLPVGHPDHMSLGQVLWFYGSAQFLFRPAELLSGIAVDVQRISVILRRVFDLMEEDPEPLDRPEAVKVPEAKGDVTFEDVTFTYPGDQHPTLYDVSFSVPSGKQVAVMGPSGAGKSSLLYLLMRFYDPEQGSVDLDGHDLRDIRLSSLRDRITLVMQEPVIFSGTVAENVRYGRLDASDEEVRRAAKDADLHQFIMSLPDSYETVVGERGMSLSGGQRQRLALAASLLSRPSVLLLDDTTSALDPSTEARVRATLNRIMKGRTCFVVTHRISTAMASDLVLVLEDGRVSQFGTPTELLPQEGLFRRVYEQQQRQSADEALT